MSFWGKADSNVQIKLNFQQNHEPWEHHGAQQEIRLTPKWQKFEYKFAAPTTTRYEGPVHGSCDQGWADLLVLQVFAPGRDRQVAETDGKSGDSMNQRSVLLRTKVLVAVATAAFSTTGIAASTIVPSAAHPNSHTGEVVTDGKTIVAPVTALLQVTGQPRVSLGYPAPSGIWRISGSTSSCSIPVWNSNRPSTSSRLGRTSASASLWTCLHTC